MARETELASDVLSSSLLFACDFSMGQQMTVRYVPNEVPDYDDFVASLQQLPGQPSQQPNEEGSTQTHPPSFLSTSECGRLQEAVRSWLLQSIQSVMKAWPPSSPKSPTSVTDKTKEDFSIYVGTGYDVDPF